MKFKTRMKKIFSPIILVIVLAIMIIITFAFIAALTDRKYENEVKSKAEVMSNFTGFVNLVFNSAAQTGTNTNDFLIIRGIKFKRVLE